MMNMDWNDARLRGPGGPGSPLASSHRHGGAVAGRHRRARARAACSRAAPAGSATAASWYSSPSRNRAGSRVIGRTSRRVVMATNTADGAGEGHGRRRRTRWRSRSPTRSRATSSDYDRERRHVHARDQRRPRVHGRADRHDQRPARAQPRRAVRGRHRPDARHARPGPVPVHLRHLLPARAARTSTRPSTSPSSGARAHDYVFEKPDWWVKQIRQMGELLLRGAVRRRRAELARVPRRRRHDRPQDGRPPGDRHDLPAHLRAVDAPTT